MFSVSLNDPLLIKLDSLLLRSTFMVEIVVIVVDEKRLEPVCAMSILCKPREVVHFDSFVIERNDVLFESVAEVFDMLLRQASHFQFLLGMWNPIFEHSFAKHAHCISNSQVRHMNIILGD